MADNSWTIDLRNVAKIYSRRVHALQGISMQVRKGEVFGLLGPNGAGKSTLVKIMMTVVRPTHAEGQVLGHRVGHKPTLARIGYLPENHRFPRYLTGRQTLEFFAAMTKVDRATARKRAAELLETVRMQEWANQKIAMYSKGMLQRIGLAQAMVNDPDLILLDEPTDGVDPVGRREIMEVLHSLRQRGKTVFINSHALSELETICDRVAILVKGQVARQGTIADLTFARLRFEIEVEASSHEDLRRLLQLFPADWQESQMVIPTAPHLPPKAVSFWRGQLPDGTRVELRGATLHLGGLEAAAAQPALDRIRAAGFVVRRLQQVRPTLEELFMEAITDPTTGQLATPGAAGGPSRKGGPSHVALHDS